MQTVEFSLAEGSALIKRLQRLRLFRWIPRKLTWEILLAVVIAWVPLLIFSASAGLALGNRVAVPFLADPLQYARFFIALPCAIALGKYINPRLQSILDSFLRGGTVVSKDITRFEEIIRRAMSLSRSMTAECVILALVYIYTSLGLQREISHTISSWNHPGNGTLLSVNFAEQWFLWVSMPLLLFCGFLWAWRIIVWAWVLFRISKLQLRLVGTHPDRVGGLGFVHIGIRRFSLLVFGLSSIFSASIGGEILFNGAALRSYELELTLFFLICLVIVLGPLLTFTPVLIRSKLESWKRYGSFATRYVQGFDDKWVLQSGYTSQELLGTPDIQSLADLRNSYIGITDMRTLLPNRTTVGILALAYVAPVIPLLGSVISLRRVLSEVYVLLLK